MPFLTATADNNLHLAVYIQPKASKNRIIGLHGAELKVAITAPPVDGKANKALIAFMAKVCGITKRDLTLRHGHNSRHKVLRIDNVTEEELRQRLS